MLTSFLARISACLAEFLSKPIETRVAMESSGGSEAVGTGVKFLYNSTTQNKPVKWLKCKTCVFHAATHVLVNYIQIDYFKDYNVSKYPQSHNYDGTVSCLKVGQQTRNLLNSQNLFLKWCSLSNMC